MPATACMAAPKLPQATGYMIGPSRWPNAPRAQTPALAATNESWPRMPA